MRFESCVLTLTLALGALLGCGSESPSAPAAETPSTPPKQAAAPEPTAAPDAGAATREAAS